MTNFIDEYCSTKACNPGPGGDYDVNKSHEYLEGRNGRAGAIMIGRGSVPLPTPFAQFGGSKSSKFNGPSSDHNRSLTPWRDPNSSTSTSRPRTSPGKPTSQEITLQGIPKGPSVNHGESLTPWRHDPNYWKVPKKERHVHRSWTCVLREKGAGGPRLATPSGPKQGKAAEAKARRRSKGNAAVERSRQQRFAAFEAASADSRSASRQSGGGLNSSGTEVVLGERGGMSMSRIPVERIIKLERPEPTAGGWAVHVWVRAGRKARRHAVLCPSAEAAGEWIEVVRNSDGFGSTRECPPNCPPYHPAACGRSMKGSEGAEKEQ